MRSKTSSDAAGDDGQSADGQLPLILEVRSPVAGRSLAVKDIPDPVFARGLVGSGLAVTPRPGRQTAVAPMSGTLTKLLPHAYLVRDVHGPGVLVHLGMDTVHLHGKGFERLVAEGRHVSAGDPIVRWDPTEVERAGHSPVCAVVALDCDPETVRLHALDREIEAGDLLFEVDC